MPGMVVSVPPELLRLRSEFLAMPGLCLTAQQAARLLSVRPSEASLLLDALVEEGLLVRSLTGTYQRAHQPAW